MDDLVLNHFQMFFGSISVVNCFWDCHGILRYNVMAVRRDVPLIIDSDNDITSPLQSVVLHCLVEGALDSSAVSM